MLLDVEMKIELKRRRLAGYTTLLVHKSEPELNDLEQVDIAFQTLILILSSLKIAAYFSYYAREFCILYKF